MIAPRTLFGRTALVIALVSVAFQLFTIAVITHFALVPLGRQATDDFAALLVDSARRWRALAEGERPGFEATLWREHRLRVGEASGETRDFVKHLPYFHFLDAALSARAGAPVGLRASGGQAEQTWYWADIPAPGGTVRLGFPDARVQVQPSLALLLILTVGGFVTLVTAAYLARRLTAPLSRLAAATQRLGKGERPEPVPESGPAELATLARQFNRLADQVEELLANRTTLLAGISHDLRTPLARLQLALGMLSEKPERDLIERALRDVEGMNGLIARCLEVSRDFAEKDSVELDLARLLSELAEEYATAGAVVRSAGGTPCPVRARPLALRRILANLLDNAVRYGGGEPVDVECERDGDAVEIRILDRGPGIPAEQREAVFRPFFRLDPSRSRRTGGSGLGLAIVRQLCEANGWSVELAARAGGGTCARLRLPLRPAL